MSTFKIHTVIFLWLLLTNPTSYFFKYQTFDNWEGPHHTQNRISMKFSPDSTSMRVQVGMISCDTATTEEIIANRGLRVELKGYPKDFKIYFMGFSMTFIDRNRDSIAKDVWTNGQFLSAEQITFLRKLNGTGKLIFDKIQVTGLNSKIRELDPFSLVIRNQ